MKPSLISYAVAVRSPLTVAVYDDDIVTLLIRIVRHLTLWPSAGCELTDREHKSCAQALTTNTELLCHHTTLDTGAPLLC